jgi:hypothetical protein
MIFYNIYLNFNNKLCVLDISVGDFIVGNAHDLSAYAPCYLGAVE